MDVSPQEFGYIFGGIDPKRLIQLLSQDYRFKNSLEAIPGRIVALDRIKAIYNHAKTNGNKKFGRALFDYRNMSGGRVPNELVLKIAAFRK